MQTSPSMSTTTAMTPSATSTSMASGTPASRPATTIPDRTSSSSTYRSRQMDVLDGVPSSQSSPSSVLPILSPPTISSQPASTALWPVCVHAEYQAQCKIRVRRPVERPLALLEGGLGPPGIVYASIFGSGNAFSSSARGGAASWASLAAVTVCGGVRECNLARAWGGRRGCTHLPLATGKKNFLELWYSSSGIAIGALEQLVGALVEELARRSGT